MGVVGLGAGLLGGLAGVGGSILIIPALHALFGSEGEAHHLYMASAMVTNLAVALPAARRHWRAGMVRRDLLPVLVGATAAAVVAGVLVSNAVDADWLRYLLAAFITGYCLLNVWRMARRRAEPAQHAGRTDRARLAASGGVTGFVGGLLGLGGGVLLVPLLQVVCNVGLRASIGTSSAVICVTALFGAGLKVGTIGEHGYAWTAPLVLAAALVPTAVVGSIAGAGLVHRLPLGAVRGVITLVLLAAAAKLVGVF